MLDGPKTESVDRLLDEMEAMAASDSSNGDLFRHVLQRLNFLLDAEGSAIIVPAREGAWLMLATGGEVNAADIQQLSVRINELGFPEQATAQRRSEPSETRILQSVGNRVWIGAPLRANSWKRGGLVAALSDRPPEAALRGLHELMAAIAEIVAIRQVRNLENFFETRWYRLHQAAEQVSLARSKPDAACLLVNELLSAVDADRISLSERVRFKKCSCLAVSGVESVDRRAATVKEIEHFAGTALCAGSTVVHRISDPTAAESSASELGSILAHALAIPFSSEVVSRFQTNRSRPSPKGEKRRLDSVVVLEWAERERFYESALLLQHLLPSFEQAWRDNRRWSRVPGIVRFFVDRPRGMLNWLSWRLLRWAACLSLAVGLLLAAQTPQELMIEARGTLEPVDERTVFASADGYVDQLRVDDGEQVRIGQLVALLRSPSMALQKQEYEGELLTLAEKRSGLQIAINQLSPEDPLLRVTQSRLSAEIREIDARVENLRRLVAVLDSESKKLELRSPIQGVVVASELRRNLLSRPVRRGDALMRIVTLDGDWRLELEVPDRDSAYVINAYRMGPKPANAKRSGQRVDFVLAANPKQRFSGEVQWISNASRNSHGTGSFVEVHVSVSRDVSATGHAGSTVQAFFACGKRPWWFVWSRPLVEAIQRRMWF